MIIPIGIGIILETCYLEDGNHTHKIKIEEKEDIMPCYTVTKVTLELNNANLDLLTKAVMKHTKSTIRSIDNGIAWLEGSYDKTTGKLVVRSEELGKLIKREYSGEIVKAQAKRFGWTVKETSDFKYQIIKR